ncbi:MAG TPA: GIY-YIG nuclease family protein [Ktedonobacteraceae bacterium]|nr:GIY-YIG nuclease family protein [Ktedonobacteraceae bacterium]
MYFVYALADPRTDIVAYVGITNNLYTRFKKHLENQEPNRKKNEWIRQLQQAKLIPSVKLLETVSTWEIAKQREVYWIRYYSAQRISLTNIRRATEETRGVKHLPVPETRKRPKYITDLEAADILGIPISEFYRYTDLGYIPFENDGITRMYPKEAIEVLAKRGERDIPGIDELRRTHKGQ